MPTQHESFDDTWRVLCDRLKLVPEGVRAIGPTVVGPTSQTLTAAGEVRLHPSLVGRLGQRCTTILDEGLATSVSRADYRPVNVKADTLPAFFVAPVSWTVKDFRSRPWTGTG